MLLAVGALAFAAPAASAATTVVDDDKVQCPKAAHTDLQAAVTAAAAGDEIVVCPGTYADGNGVNGLVVDKALTIRGAGADQVRIEPAGDIGATGTETRDEGNVVWVEPTSGTVDISGVTIASGGHYAEAGVVFRDVKQARFRRSRITELSGGLDDFSHPAGVGVFAYATTAGPVGVEVSDSLLEGYGKGGVVIDSDAAGHPIDGIVQGNVIRGRGPLNEPGQGQNGVQVSGEGASATISGNHIADHRFTPDESSSVGVLLVGADVADTSIGDNNLQGNGYGVFNADADGCDNPPPPVAAPRNWWGNPAGPSQTVTPQVGPCNPPAGSPNYIVTGSPPLGDRVNAGSVLATDFRTTPLPAPLVPAAQPDTAPSVAIASPADGAVVPPGSDVTVTATATDDFDVSQVEFLRGSTVVATRTTRPYSATVTAPGAGSSQAITVRATDSSGQTASQSVAIQGESPLPPPTAPQEQQQQPQQQQQADDRPPSVTITGPADGASIDPSAAPRISAQAGDDQGVARVGFLDDGKLVCTDDTAPYECAYAPSGDDVGRNTLIAIAVDGAGQTAVDFRAVSVARFAPRLTAATTPKRDRKRPYRYATSGALVLPSGVTPAQACGGGGSVAIEFSAGKLKVPTIATLKADCTYKTSIAFPSRRSLGTGRLSVKTSFAGNGVVAAAKAKTQKVRAG